MTCAIWQVAGQVGNERSTSLDAKRLLGGDGSRLSSLILFCRSGRRCPLRLSARRRARSIQLCSRPASLHACLHLALKDTGYQLETSSSEKRLLRSAVRNVIRRAHAAVRTSGTCERGPRGTRYTPSTGVKTFLVIILCRFTELFHVFDKDIR